MNITLASISFCPGCPACGGISGKGRGFAALVGSLWGTIHRLEHCHRPTYGRILCPSREFHFTLYSHIYYCNTCADNFVLFSVIGIASSAFVLGFWTAPYGNRPSHAQERCPARSQESKRKDLWSNDAKRTNKGRNPAGQTRCIGKLGIGRAVTTTTNCDSEWWHSYSLVSTISRQQSTCVK